MTRVGPDQSFVRARPLSLRNMAIGLILTVAASVLTFAATSQPADAQGCDATVGTEPELVAAVACFNTGSADLTVIELSADIALIDELTVENPNDPAPELVIAGNGFAIDAAVDEEVFSMRGGDLTLQELTVDAADGRNAIQLFEGAGDLMLSLVRLLSFSNPQSGIGIRSQADHSGQVTIERSTVEGFATGYNSTSLLHVHSSTFRNNETAIINSGPSTVVNSTFSGGIGVRAFADSDISYSTFVDSANSPLSVRDGVTTTVTAVLFARNNGQGCSILPAGVLVDGGGNVFEGAGSGSGCGDIVPFSGPHGDANDDLDVLAGNPCAPSLTCPQTVALLGALSPANGAAVTCGVAVDQRGLPRPATNCDAGAYEADFGTFVAQNAEPIAGDDEPTNTVIEDDVSTQFVFSDLLFNDTDADADQLTIVSLSNPTPSDAGVLTLDTTGGNVRFEPASNFNGDVSFDYTIEDGFGGSDTATVSFTVLPRNDLPTAVDDVYTVTEDSTNNVFDVLVNDQDIEMDPLEIVRIVSSEPPSAGVATISADKKQILFTPDADFGGEFVFEYEITDMSAFGDGGDAIGQVTVTVTNVNDAPVAVDDDNLGGLFDVFEDTDALGLPVLANDSDPDEGDTENLRVQSVTAAVPASSGLVAVSASGTAVDFMPAPDYTGLVTFEYTVEDPSAATATAQVELFVFPINDAPVAVDDSETMQEDGPPLDVDVLSNDTDVDSGGSDLSLLSVTQPADGTTTTFGSRVRYIPPANFSGTATFSYTAADVEGLTSTATVTVTITPVNDAPQANNDSSDDIPKDSSLNEIDVLANDTDVDDNDELRVVRVENPASGTALITAAGTILYTPVPGFEGSLSFEYTIADPAGAESTAQIFVRVIDPNQPPDAVDDTITIDTELDSGAVLVDVLANDTDPDGDDFVITQVTFPVFFPAFGPIIGEIPADITGDGKAVLVTPPPGFIGTAEFVYRIADSSGSQSSGVANLTFIGPEPTCNGLLVTINMQWGVSGIGTAGDDVILGTSDDDVIDGLGGNDTVCALAGDDQVVGNDGNDTIFGDEGRDLLRGGPGEDVLEGGDGDDRILGGVGADIMRGGPGDDYLGGFGGDDRIFGGAGDEVVFGGFGADTIDGGAGDDEIHGLIGNDIINGGSGNDTIDGDRGNDTINGGAGDDVIRGGNANDVINGGDGNDEVSGGRADDTLSGGDDVDICVGNKEIERDVADASCETTFGIP